MVEEADELGVRAKAAIAAASVLCENLRRYREVADKLVKQIYFRASFHPKTLKLFSPLDFPEIQRSSKPIPSEAES